MPSQGQIEDSAEGFYVCSLCECPIKTHCYFVACPLLDNEMIDIDCCQEFDGVSDDKVIENLKELGKEHTRESIDAICKGCGNRCVKTDVMILPNEFTEEKKSQ